MGWSAAEQALLNRWDGFLAKISDRQTELMEEIEGQIPHLPTYQSLLTAFGALDARVERLEQKVKDTWDDKVEGQFEACNSVWSFRDAGIRRQRDHVFGMQQRWSAFKVRVLAEAAKGLRPAAEKEIANPLRCDGCGVDLVPDKPWQPQTMTCVHCGGVKQILVRPGIHNYYSYAPTALGNMAALPLFLQMEQEEHAFSMLEQQTSEAELASLQKRYDLTRQYWRTFASAHAAISSSRVVVVIGTLSAACLSASATCWRRYSAALGKPVSSGAVILKE